MAPRLLLAHRSHSITKTHLITNMKKTISALIAALSIAAVSYAGPVNAGFESGLTGWTTNGGPTSVVSSYTTQINTLFLPQQGSNFLLLTGGLGNGVATTVSQTFSLNVGDVLSGSAGFFADDYSPYNDYGLASLSLGMGSTTLFFANISSVGGQNGTTGWVPWSFTALSAGSYTLTYSAANTGDNAYASHAFFDSASVPDAGSTVALIGLGFATLVGFRRRMIKA